MDVDAKRSSHYEPHELQPRPVTYTQMGDGKVHPFQPVAIQQRSISNLLAAVRAPQQGRGLPPIGEAPVDSALEKLQEPPLQKYQRVVDAIQTWIKKSGTYFYPGRQIESVIKATEALIEIVQAIPMSEQRAEVVVHLLGAVYDGMTGNIGMHEITYKIGRLMGRCDEWQLQDYLASTKTGPH